MGAKKKYFTEEERREAKTQYARKWNATHPDTEKRKQQKRDAMRRYRENHPDRVKASNTKMRESAKGQTWLANNREKRNAQSTSYYWRDPEQARAKQRAWNYKNPDKIKAKQTRYLAKLTPAQASANAVRAAMYCATPEYRARERQRRFDSKNEKAIRRRELYAANVISERARQARWRAANPEYLKQKYKRDAEVERAERDAKAALSKLMRRK